MWNHNFLNVPPSCSVNTGGSGKTELDNYGNSYTIYTKKCGPIDSLLLTKISYNGNLIWTRCFYVGVQSIAYIGMFDLSIGASNVPIINFKVDSTGPSNAHFTRIARCDTSGNIVNTRDLSDYVYLALDKFENVIVCKIIPSPNSNSIRFMKLDSTLNLLYDIPDPSPCSNFSFGPCIATNSKQESIFEINRADSLLGWLMSIYKLNNNGVIIDSIIILNSMGEAPMFDSRDNLYIPYSHLYSTDSAKTFIRKYDSTMVQLWDTGPTLMRRMYYFQLDSSGNLFGLGKYDDVTNLFNESRIGKFDSSGNLVWMQKFGTTQNGQFQHLSEGMSLDNDNNILVWGEYNKNGYVSGGNNLIFIKRLDQNGILLDNEEVQPNTGGGTTMKGIAKNNTIQITSDGLIFDIHQFCIDCSPSITGHVFIDNNNDCILDSNEMGLRNAIIEIVPGIMYLNTDSAGYYHCYQPDGTYQVTSADFLNFSNTCLNDTLTVIIDSITPLQIVNFGKYIDPLIHDLSVNAGNTPFRPGLNSQVTLHYKNNAGNTENGFVDFVMDSSIIFVSANIPPVLPGGDTLRWNFTDLEPGESMDIYVVINTPSNVSIGTAISNAFYVQGNYTDFTPADNEFILNDTVTGSFDPNTKTVSPQGFGSSGNITAWDSILHYTINFENVGNDTAFTVVVLDTLDTDLNISSLEIDAVSHPFSWKFINPNILSFRFVEINLTPLSNPDYNKGFINYHIKTKKGLALGTEIKNSADIYFDVNYPIKTNQTLNTISSLAGIKEIRDHGDFILTPNPTSDFVEISSNSNSIQKVAMYTIDGREQQLSIVYNNNKVTIDVSALKQGIYIVQIFTQQGIFSRKIVKI